MADDVTRIGIIGAGDIASAHMRSYAQDERVRLVGIVECGQSYVAKRHAGHGLA